MTLLFYCKYSTDKFAPFIDDSEALLSPSIIAIRDKDGNIIGFYPENQTGKGFLEMVETLIANKKIIKVTLLNTAYLQRHREKLLLLAKNIPEKEAKKKSENFALQNWEKWQEQNCSAIELLKNHYKNNFSILNWNSLLQDGKFTERKKIADKLFHNESGKQAKKFKKAINGLEKIFHNKISADIEARKKQFGSNLTLDDTTKNLREIALEECALRTILAFSYEIYRGQCNVAAEMFYDMYGEKGKMKFISIGNEEEIQKLVESDKQAFNLKSANKKLVESDKQVLNMNSTKKKNKQIKVTVTKRDTPQATTLQLSITIPTISSNEASNQFIKKMSALLSQFGSFPNGSPTSPEVGSPSKGIEVK